MAKQHKRIFDLKEVGYTDLDGNFQKVPFDQKDLANALFMKASSIDMDDFARSIHKEGKAELNDTVQAELEQVLPTLYMYRVVQAVKETISKL